jgi:hypothetical protein
MSLIQTQQQRLESYDEFVRMVIEITCEAALVHQEEFFSSKRKEIFNARSVAGTILREQGYTFQTISDVLCVDVKSVHTYYKSHDNRMADRIYSALYAKVKRLLKNIGGMDDDIVSSMKKLMVRVEKIENRMDHITKLLTN